MTEALSTTYIEDCESWWLLSGAVIDQLTKVCYGQVPGDGAAMPSGSVGGGERQPPSHSVVLQEARASKQRLHALSQPDPLDGRLQGTVSMHWL